MTSLKTLSVFKSANKEQTVSAATRLRISKPLTPSERVLYNALLEGEHTIDELVEILYRGVKDGGPLCAKNCVMTHLYFIRKKTGATITDRHVYRLE
jgi:hypothetical protein